MLWSVLIITSRSEVVFGYQLGNIIEPVPSIRILLLPVVNGLVFLIDVVASAFFYRREDQKFISYLIAREAVLPDSLFLCPINGHVKYMIFPSIHLIHYRRFLSQFNNCLDCLLLKIQLSKSGAIAALLVGAIVFGLGGLVHTAVLLTFFFSSSILSVILKKQKHKVNKKYAKGSRRDAGQVLANGGVATLCVIVGAFFPDRPIFWWMFYAAFAAANADTWATEIGALSEFAPRLITSFKQVEAGTSGGITLLGSVSALAGSSIGSRNSSYRSNGVGWILSDRTYWLFRFSS